MIYVHMYIKMLNRELLASAFFRAHWKSNRSYTYGASRSRWNPFNEHMGKLHTLHMGDAYPI